LATKIFIYCVGEEEESLRHLAQECPPPPPTSSFEGGYDLLKKNIMEEKLKSLKETSSLDDVISPPSPPNR